MSSTVLVFAHTNISLWNGGWDWEGGELLFIIIVHMGEITEKKQFLTRSPKDVCRKLIVGKIKYCQVDYYVKQLQKYKRTTK